MKPLRIFIVRHGESEGNADKATYSKFPDYAIKLTKKGEQQALDAGKNLRESIGSIGCEKEIAFYVSPFHRARQTYEQMIKSFSDFEIRTRIDPRLREHEWGSRLEEEGYKHDADKERDAYGKFYYRFENGESGADADLRICSFLNDYHRHTEEKDFPPVAVIVMHGELMRLFIRRWFNMSIEEYEMFRSVPNGHIITLMKETSSDKYHLSEPLRLYDTPTHSFQYKEKNNSLES